MDEADKDCVFRNLETGAAARGAASFPAYPPETLALGQELFEWLGMVKVAPVSAVDWRCAPGWGVGPRRVPDAMWSYIVEGRGEVWIGSPETRLELGPGDLALFPKMAEHQVTGNPAAPFRMVNVHFLANVFGGVDLTGLLGLAGLHRPWEGAAFAASSAELAREFALKPPGWREVSRALIHRTLLDLLRRRGLDRDAPAAELSRLAPALALIEKRLADEVVAVKDMAEAVGVSEVYLRRLFQRALGTNPVAYARQRRVDRACELLRETDTPIQNVADLCGFSDKYFFHHVFKRLTGLTPAAYRNHGTP